MAEKEKGLGDEKAPSSEKAKKKKNNKKKKGKSRAKNNSNNKGSPACQESEEDADEAATNYNHLVGREVEVVGTSRAELNGKRGKVIDFNVNKQRYNVELNHLPIIIALKRENIVDAFEIDRYVCVYVYIATLPPYTHIFLHVHLLSLSHSLSRFKTYFQFHCYFILPHISQHIIHIFLQSCLESEKRRNGRR
jgi:RNase P/RNase MRP subunit p29